MKEFTKRENVYYCFVLVSLLLMISGGVIASMLGSKVVLLLFIFQFPVVYLLRMHKRFDNWLTRG